MIRYAYHIASDHYAYMFMRVCVCIHTNIHVYAYIYTYVYALFIDITKCVAMTVLPEANHVYYCTMTAQLYGLYFCLYPIYFVKNK